MLSPANWKMVMISRGPAHIKKAIEKRARLLRAKNIVPSLAGAIALRSLLEAVRKK